MAGNVGLFDGSTRKAATLGAGAASALALLPGIMESRAKALRDGDAPAVSDAQKKAVIALQDMGHIYTDSHLQAQYQFVHVLVSYDTRRGKVVIPRGAASGAPAVCRRYAPFTWKEARWSTCRIGQQPELPAVEESATQVLIRDIILGKSCNIAANGRTLIHWVDGVYLYALTKVKTPNDTYELPRNAALLPGAVPSTIPSSLFYTDYIP